MRENTYRILDILAREIGNPMSINEIKNSIRRVYSSADYKNIYNAIREMEESKLIGIKSIGRSSIAVLNFENPLLIDNLAEMELIRKIHFLKERKEWQLLVLLIVSWFEGLSDIKSIIAVRPEINAKLNRLELVVLLRDASEPLQKNIEKQMYLLQRVHNIKIDYLLITEKNFERLLRYEDANMIKEAMSDKIVIFHPQTFWFMIKSILDKGLNIQVEEEPISLAKISERDLVFNLARFGYKEMGTKITQGKPIGIEYIVISIMLKRNNIRRIEAIPIILAKNNDKVNYSLLVFLASKFKVIRQLHSILKVLDELKPTKEVKDIMKRITETMMKKIKEDQKTINLNLKDMEKKMRLYDVIE